MDEVVVAVAELQDPAEARSVGGEQDEQTSGHGRAQPKRSTELTSPQVREHRDGETHRSHRHHLGP